MHKCVTKNIIRTICFVLVFLFVFSKVSHLLERKDSTERYSEFWSNPDEYDVWLLGTSHMRYSIQPMELWKDYGFRSYNLGAPSSYIPQVYWTLMNALDYGTPKAVVVDCYHVEGKAKTYQNDAIEKVHTGFDAIPLSPTKIRAVYDIFDTTELRLEYLLPFSTYHNRWETLEKKDFEPEYSVLKGSRLEDAVSDEFPLISIAETSCSKKEALGHLYLRKIIEECQKRDIPIILTAIPFHTQKYVQRAVNKVADIAEEYDVPFLNMAYANELSLDYPIDFYDCGHLNKAGAQKVTTYLGAFLQQNFNLSEGISDADALEWNEDYTLYESQKIERQRSISKLNNYLLWMSGEDYLCEIYQEESLQITDDSILGRLLQNLPNKKMISYEEAAGEIGTDFDGNFAVIVKDSVTNDVLDTAVFKDAKRLR